MYSARAGPAAVSVSVAPTNGGAGTRAAVAGVVVRAGVREVMVVAAGRTTVGVVVATGMDVVTVLADVAALIAWVDAVAPQVDLGIVNAGVTSNVRAGEGWSEIDRVLAVNVRAALATAAALAAAMRERKRGQIALVSSIAA